MTSTTSPCLGNSHDRPERTATMQRLLWAAMCLTACTAAHGHGVPITVHTAGSAISVSHSAGAYARYIFGQHEEEGDPQGPLNLPGFGPSLYWELPGMDIYDLADDASLSLQVVAPVGPDGEPQTLWYWNESTRDVEPAPSGSELQILLLDGSDPVLRAEDTSAPPPFVLAEMLAGETGYHNHSLMNFRMPYDGAPDWGLYGFFARLNSDPYEPSETMLLLFNLGASYGEMAPASEAIWGAAFPGDYNRDGVVDQSDYLLWTNEFGATPSIPYMSADGNGDGVVDAADYTVWRDAEDSVPTAIPESATLTAGVLVMLIGRRLASSRSR